MVLFRIPALCLIAALPSLAQPVSPNPRAVTLTHIHLNSADPDAATAFWKNFIGMGTHNRDGMKGVSTLGALLVFSKSAPAGPSAGSAIDHIAFKVPDVQSLVAKLAKTPYKSFKPNPEIDTVMIDGPDGVRIEILEENNMYAPLEFSHIHLRTPQANDTQAWYAKHFGARPGTEDQANTSRLPNVTFTFTSAETALPTVGRAIDHISFETRDLAGLSELLKSAGLKLDTSSPAVYLADPWGTRIEITAALNQ